MALKDNRRERIVAIRDLCVAICEDVKPGIRASGRFRDVTPGSRRSQDRIIGETAYYLEVIPSPAEASDTLRTNHNAAVDIQELYQVSLWLEYEDADAYAGSSQSEYDSLAAGPNGLLTKLRSDGQGLPSNNLSDPGLECITLGQPTSVQEPIVELDLQGRLAHLLRFTLPTTVHLF